MGCSKPTKGGCTWYYDVNSSSWIPLEAHRVTQQRLRFQLLGSRVPAATPAAAVQSVDVVRQAQQLAGRIYYLQLQEVPAAPHLIHMPHHINHTHQFEQPARTEGIKKNCEMCCKPVLQPLMIVLVI